VHQAFDDLQIFVFTAANARAQQNLEKSIENPVRDEIVFESFEEADEGVQEQLARVREDGNGFYAWGSEPRGHAPSTWDKMNRGDYVLGYYARIYHYLSRVLGTFHNPTLATNIWGVNEHTGQTWEYMYFLTKPVKIDRPVSWVADLLGLDETSLMYQGFSRMAGANREAVLDTHGSVQHFINRLLGYDSDSVPPQLLLASGRSEDVAESSLQVDQIAHGEVDEKLIPEVEGREHIVQHRRYERSPKNRKLAIQEHGTICKVCGFDFDEVYGHEYADGYIQIHHVKPLFEHEGEVNPTTDLVPLCANCHSMAHRRRTSVTSIEKLKALIEEANG
jgi:5-methylcytosine-specific restriction endonuclease McrA